MMSAVSDSPARVTISAPPGSGCLPRAGHLGLVTLGGKGYHGEEQARGIEGRKRSAAGYEIVDHGDGGKAFWPYLQYVMYRPAPKITAKAPHAPSPVATAGKPASQPATPTATAASAAAVTRTRMAMAVDTGDPCGSDEVTSSSP